MIDCIGIVARVSCFWSTVLSSPILAYVCTTGNKGYLGSLSDNCKYKKETELYSGPIRIETESREIEMKAIIDDNWNMANII